MITSLKDLVQLSIYSTRALFQYMITSLKDLVQLSIYSTRALLHRYVLAMNYR